VEITLVIIVFITLLGGVLDFGRALYTYHYVSMAARDGARYAAVRGSLSTLCTGTAGGCPTDGSNVQTYIRNNAILVDTGVLNVTTYYGANITPAAPTLLSCGSDAATNSPGCEVQVVVTYTFSFIFPFMSKNGLSMTGQSEMVISQ
jgi:Flp pilus assembly protein TadG